MLLVKSFFLLFLNIKLLAAQTVNEDSAQISTHRTLIGLGVGLPVGLNTTVSYRFSKPVSLNLGIGTLTPAFNSINYIAGITFLLGDKWEPSVIMNASYTMLQFHGDNIWESVSVGLGNIYLEKHFYWQAGVLYARHKDPVNQYPVFLPHFNIGWILLQL